MAERYSALQDCTVHVKDADDTSKGDDKNPRNDTQRSVTLEAGDSFPVDELADVDAQLFEDGKLGHLLVKVSEAQADKLLEEKQGGESGYSPFTMVQKGLSPG